MFLLERKKQNNQIENLVSVDHNKYHYETITLFHLNIQKEIRLYFLMMKKIINDVIIANYFAN